MGQRGQRESVGPPSCVTVLGHPSQQRQASYCRLKEQLLGAPSHPRAPPQLPRPRTGAEATPGRLPPSAGADEQGAMCPCTHSLAPRPRWPCKGCDRPDLLTVSAADILFLVTTVSFNHIHEDFGTRRRESGPGSCCDRREASRCHCLHLGPSLREGCSPEPLLESQKHCV